MDENLPSSGLNSAINELNRLNYSEDGMQSIRFRSSPYFHESRPHSNSFSATSKLEMNLNPRYISKISNSPRKIPETSHRMRPYFIPERSRTKSENADNNHHTIQNFDLSSSIPNTTISLGYRTNTNTTQLTSLNNNNYNNPTTMMDFSCDSNNISGDMYIMGGGGSGSDSISNNDCDFIIGGGGGASCYEIGTPGPSSAVLSSSLQTQMCANKSRKFALTKKSKSLEDVRAENIDGSLTSHEMEFVSSRIQKLKF